MESVAPVDLMISSSGRRARKKITVLVDYLVVSNCLPGFR